VSPTRRNNRVGATRHAYKIRGEDLYSTPACATEALLGAEKFEGLIWEPACGRGAISDVLKAAGYDVLSSDLTDYGYGESRRDFLLEPQLPPGVTAIVTNFPYKLAAECVRKAIRLGTPKICALMRLAFLESVSRADILDEGSGLARVYPFSQRVPFFHRDGYQGPKTSSTIAYAWFCWKMGHKGPATIKRLYFESPRTQAKTPNADREKRDSENLLLEI
jgi:hypothetical protein